MTNKQKTGWAAAIAAIAAAIGIASTTNNPPKPDNPTPPTPVVNLPGDMTSGYYTLQPGDPKRPLTLAQVQKKQTKGVTIRFPMAIVAVDPDPSKWDWSYPDAQKKKMETANKPFKLLFMSGGNTPHWVGGEWTMIQPDPKKPAVKGAPLPWTKENREFVRTFYREAGKRYDGHRLLAGVHVTGGTRHSTSEELHPDPSWNNDAGMEEAYNGFIDNAIESFPKTPTYWLAISVQGRAKNYVPKIVEHGLAAARGKFGVKHNALKFGSIDADHNLAVVRYTKNGARMGFEMLGGTGENKDGGPRLGTRKIMDCIEQGRKLADAAGYPREKVLFDVYPPDIDALK